MKVPAQACAECHTIHAKDGGQFLKGGNVCKACRKENQQMKFQQTLAEKRNKAVLGVIGLLDKTRNTETDKKLLEALYGEFDGLEGFAGHTRKVFDNAKPGSQAQVQIVRAMIGLQQSVSAHTEAPDISQWSDQELWSTVMQVSEQMLRNAAERVIDVEPGQYPAIEQDQEASGDDAGCERPGDGDGGTGETESGEPEAV